MDTDTRVPLFKGGRLIGKGCWGKSCFKREVQAWLQNLKFL